MMRDVVLFLFWELNGAEVNATIRAQRQNLRS
jgi:hypothetical protein